MSVRVDAMESARDGWTLRDANVLMFLLVPVTRHSVHYDSLIIAPGRRLKRIAQTLSAAAFFPRHEVHDNRFALGRACFRRA